MNVWIVAPSKDHAKLVEPLKEAPYRVFCNDTVKAAFEALPAGLPGGVDAFVLVGLDAPAASLGLTAIRCNPVVAKTPVLVVLEGLDDAAAKSLRQAGADLCYRLPFAPAVFAARVRAALALKA
jgi:DNA-binding response OmpR family regulator